MTFLIQLVKFMFNLFMDDLLSLKISYFKIWKTELTLIG